MANTSFLTPPLSPKSTPADMPHSTITKDKTNNNSSSTTVAHSPIATGSSTPTLSSSLIQGGGDNHPLSQILVLYHKATSTFLLRQLASAYSTSLEALELLARANQEYGLDHTENISTRRSFFILKQKLWILHTTIFGSMLSDRAAAPAVNNVRKRFSGSAKDSPEKLVKDLWKRLVDDYSGLEGDVDGQVMVPFTLMCVNQKLYSLARQIVEAYLATIPDGMLIHLETAAGVSLGHGSADGQKDPLITNYERLVELYLIHVLAKLGEWESATDFLQYNSVLSETSKKAYGKILNRLHQKSLRPKKSNSTKHQISSDKSLSSSTSSSSTSVSSPTLASTSTMSSPSITTSHSTDSSSSNTVNEVQSNNNTDLNGVVTGSTKKPVSSTLANNIVRTKVAVSKQGSPSSNSVTTLQGKILELLKHYIKLIRDAPNHLGANQLMAIVGLVAFMGALSRNRTRASEYFKAGMTKLMQTVKMGTTVTSI